MWEHKINEIRRLHLNSTQQMKALLTFYVRYHYAPSWQDIASALQEMELHDVADVVTTKYVRGTQLCRFIIATLNLHQSLILCLTCCTSCTNLVVPDYYISYVF